jgi:tetratricopeptide (TPR) repeat protein
MRKLFGLTAIIIIASGSAFASPDNERLCVAPPPTPQAAPTIIDACTALLAQKSDHARRADLLMKRGRALKRLGRLEEAAADLDQAISLTPKDAGMRLWRGWIAFDAGNHTYATTLAEQAVSLRPDLSAAFNLLGAAAVQAGNFAGARAAYDKAIAINPADLHARDNRLRMYRGLGAQQEELRDLDEILALKIPELDAITETVRRRPVSLRVKRLLERAELLKAMGRTQEAAKAYDKFVRDDPGAMSYGMRAHFYNMMDDLDRAMTDIDRAIKADDKFAYLHSERGFILSSLRRYSEAEASFTRAALLDDKDGPALWGRAKARRAMNQLEPAIADAQTALTTDVQFLQFKAKSLVELGYLPEKAEDNEVLAAIRDAAQACMIDTRCW